MSQRAIVVGSGPNGLVAAVVLARAGYEVRVLEAQDSPGGAVRTAELTLPGFRHDIGSAVHPAALSSPVLKALGLDRSVDWLTPTASFAHPLDDGQAAIAWRSLDRTADGLGLDGDAWRRLIGFLGRHLSGVVDFTHHQLLRIPRDPIVAAGFGIRALAAGVGASGLGTTEGAALLQGVLAHANTRLPSVAAAASGLYLAAHAHSVGWPSPRGGAQAIADALLADLAAHGGTVETRARVERLDELDRDPTDLLLLDAPPRLALTLPDVPSGWARAVRAYRYGPAAAKVDLALGGPIPWAHPDVGRSPTVHLGGTAAEIATAENHVQRGRMTQHPYVLAVQPSVLDDTRAPEGKAVLWAYIHVPSWSTLDPVELVTRQVERFAPGFRDLVLASHSTTAVEQAEANPSAVGGDILAGTFTLVQALRRPVVSTRPWRTPMRGVYLASAATPPGPGVTGLAGWYAASTALADRGIRLTLADL